MEQLGNLSFRHGSEAQRGGIDITISLKPEEVKALGSEASIITDWFDSALWALAMLRTNTNTRTPEQRPSTPDDWYTVINDLDHRLLPRLQGLRDAAIRRHHELGGSINNLALAMDAPKSTAQSRRNTVLEGRDRPSAWETWALKGGPQNREHCAACGHPGSSADPIVTTADNDRYRIHHSHTEDPQSGFHGTPITED